MKVEKELQFELVDAVVKALKSPRGYIIVGNNDIGTIHHAFAGICADELMVELREIVENSHNQGLLEHHDHSTKKRVIN